MKHDELISRQQAIHALKELTANGTNKGMIFGEDAVHRIEMLPSAQPEQRTGHWYPVGMVEAVGGESAQWGSVIAYHRCSECDEQALRDDFEQEVLSDFCPHCGCRMERMSE